MLKRIFDLSTLFGIITTLIILSFAITDNNGNYLAFIDKFSILIVICGTFLITTACFTIGEIIRAHVIIINFTLYKQPSNSDLAKELIRLAEFSRKFTVIELENRLNKNFDNSLFKKGIIMINQGMKLENIEKIITREIITTSNNNDNVVSILRKSGEISPAMGLIGTLIGLVQMLGNLSDPSKLGPSMAIALLTTFYGAVMAYIIFFPLSSKIERNSREEIMASEIMLATILSIAKSENPRYLENNINSILLPGDKINYY